MKKSAANRSRVILDVNRSRTITQKLLAQELQLRSTATPSIPQSATFLHRLRNAGIEAGNSDDLKIRKTILVFAMGLMTAAPMFWLGVYWLMGIQLSATLPLGFQIVSVATLLIYVATRSFAFFCYAQLSLFLFFPFVAQLSIGSFISASGVVLWGILAPICAVPVLGARASLPWFVGHIAIIAMCGVVDYQLANSLNSVPNVPLRTSAVFFSLNFAAISGMAFFCCASPPCKRNDMKIS